MATKGGAACAGTTLRLHGSAAWRHAPTASPATAFQSLPLFHPPNPTCNPQPRNALLPHTRPAPLPPGKKRDFNGTGAVYADLKLSSSVGGCRWGVTNQLHCGVSLDANGLYMEMHVPVCNGTDTDTLCWVVGWLGAQGCCVALGVRLVRRGLRAGPHTPHHDAPHCTTQPTHLHTPRSPGLLAGLGQGLALHHCRDGAPDGLRWHRNDWPRSDQCMMPRAAAAPGLVKRAASMGAAHAHVPSLQLPWEHNCLTDVLPAPLSLVCVAGTQADAVLALVRPDGSVAGQVGPTGPRCATQPPQPPPHHSHQDPRCTMITTTLRPQPQPHHHNHRHHMPCLALRQHGGTEPRPACLAPLAPNSPFFAPYQTPMSYVLHTLPPTALSRSPA